MTTVQKKTEPTNSGLCIDNRWALHPAVLDDVCNQLSVYTPEDLDAAARRKSTGYGSYTVHDGGVAVIKISGIIQQELSIISILFGGSSSVQIKGLIADALKDRTVKSILLDINSPGGTVAGTKELSDYIFTAKQIKPIHAYTSGIMASSAYWIGSAADSITASETAMVGSIGVAYTHYDRSEADNKIGIKRTVLSAGTYKRVASDEKPLSEEGKDYIQSIVDGVYSIFVRDVARNRGFMVSAVLAYMADGKEFLGEQALKAGLVDNVGSFETALNNLKGASKMDLETLKRDFPEVYQAAFEAGAGSVSFEAAMKSNPEAAERLRAEGVQSERTRVTELLEAGADHGATVKAITEGTPAADAYKAFFEAAKVKPAEPSLSDLQKKALERLAAEAPESMGSEEPPAPTSETFESLVEKAMAADPKLTKAQAVAKVARENEKLHEEYVSRINRPAK